MRKEWNHSEIGILRQNYTIKTPGEMQQLLPNRSLQAINHKAFRLKMPKTDYFWTDDELYTLRRVYPHLSKNELLTTFSKKDWTSIRHKAFELKLTKAPHMRYSSNWKNHGDVQVKLGDFEKGYVAAIIDGEGMIRVSKTHDHRWSVAHYYLAPLISIVNTDAKLMAGVRDMLKIGRFYKETSKVPEHKDKYVYNIGSINGCKQILEQIKDVLIVKKRQAEAVLKLIAIKEKKATGAVTDEEIELFEEVKRLNARGKP